MTAVTDPCPESTYKATGTEPCGKQVKRDGLCGMHANARDRRQKTAANVVTLAEERRVTAVTVNRTLAELGVQAQHVEGSLVTVHIDELVKLARGA